MVQSDKYYKSCAVGVRSEVGLTTDRDLSVLMCLRNTTSFVPPRYWKSHGMSQYTTYLLLSVHQSFFSAHSWTTGKRRGVNKSMKEKYAMVEEWIYLFLFCPYLTQHTQSHYFSDKLCILSWFKILLVYIFKESRIYHLNSRFNSENYWLTMHCCWNASIYNEMHSYIMKCSYI